jgi:tellurite resistance protein
MSATRVPLNFFGIGFGLAGLGEAWGFAAGQGLAPRWAGDAILALSAVAWLAGISLYLRYAATTRGAFAADLRDNVAGPFASLAMITPWPGCSSARRSHPRSPRQWRSKLPPPP